MELKIVLPTKLYKKLEELEKKLGVTKEDIVARAIVRVIEEFGE